MHELLHNKQMLSGAYALKEVLALCVRGLPWIHQLLLAAVLIMTVSCGGPHGSDDASERLEEAGVDHLIRRDLTAYFTRRSGAPVRLEYSYLRQGPTVTGIAYSKYYLWMIARDSSGSRILAEGAARVAEIDSTIEVTHFFPREYIRSSPASIDSVFPQPVLPEIRWRM